MSLNIKNKQSISGQRITQATGKSMTAVVLDALRLEWRKLQRDERKEAHVQELMDIAKRCAAHIQQPMAAVDHSEMLYDDHGMPQ